MYIKKALIKFINSFFKIFNIGITSYSKLESYKELKNDIKLINKRLKKVDRVKFNTYVKDSKAQLYQDLVVLTELNFKQGGYFVEFGATNGIDLSNTYLLEKKLFWDGILAEPAKCWQEELKRNRKCNIETDCVWKDSNSTISFNQVEIAELSTINTFSNSDNNYKLRENGKNYNVNTISLLDLLIKYNAPKTIDYLSIDTEGSEYDILRNFDFSKYQFNIISCEHNYSSDRENIYKLLTSKGYVRKYSSISKWDDWYFRKDLNNNL
ncbi:FkbM family methyltransferase [Gaetbulibacter sp. M235]|uniref:FkbM family methyltransferase n=1 Tax=Gaetbulibacter sp. M235 TaxID=3126510 RepID=UPI00374ED40D